MRNMADVLQEAGTAYSSWAPEFTPDFFLFVLTYYVFLHSEFHGVMSVTISA